MSRINIKKDFTLSIDELKKLLDELAEDMHSRYQMDCNWQSDSCMSFKRSGAKGEIDIVDNRITFTLNLGIILSAFKKPIEKDIQKFISENIY